jgi:glycosyltransferase involved in cell wall biosynthesis
MASGEIVVSVVIPTTGRSELSRAVASARSQQGPFTIEVIVIADLPEDAPSSAEIAGIEGVDIIRYTGGGTGAAVARNLGVRVSAGSWIAFLDDDDEWESTKTWKQLQLADEDGATVVSCRVRQRDAESGRIYGSPVPRRVIRPEEKPAHYLFRRRRPSASRSSLFTSTLLVRRDLAKAIVWDDSLRRHQDWDWIIRASRHEAYALRQLSDVETTISVGSVGSISAGSSWSDSLTWGIATLTTEPDLLIDFAFRQPLRVASDSSAP